MNGSGNNAASIGLGCLLDVALFIVAAAALSADVAASLFLYMMAMAIPVWIVRLALFNDSTPKWMRVLIGPAGALLCLVNA